MKTKLIIAIGCCGILLSGYALAGCPGAQSCQSPKNICAYQRNCTCTDPACNLQNDCLSKSRCCEAFGNVGEMED